MKKLAQLLSFVLILVVGNSCRQRVHYGIEHNQERVKLGIPPIPENWKIASVTPNDATWRNPELSQLLKSKTPFYVSKYVNYKLGKLSYEQDAYYGFEDFQWEETTLRERLYITYYYKHVVSDSGNSFELVDQIASYSNKDGLMQDISLSDAKEILKSWGLSYQMEQ